MDLMEVDDANGLRKLNNPQTFIPSTYSLSILRIG